MNIELNKDQRSTAIASIQRYFREHMEEPVGNLQAAALLDFFVQEVGPSIYNSAVAQVQAHMQQRVMELDIDCHAEEFGFWQKSPRAR